MRAALAVACLIACGAQPRSPMPSPSSPSPSPSPSPSGLAAAAVAGVTDPALRDVIADHWEYTMRWSPTWATTLGDHRFDDKLAPRDAASIAAAQAEHDAILARVVALDGGRLGDVDRVTLALLRGRLEAEHAMFACKFHEWNVDSANSSAFGELSYLVELHTVSVPRDAANLVARMGQGAKQVDDTIANLMLGLADGRGASAE
jgi:uncharacterized protein (DUF885 family)